MEPQIDADERRLKEITETIIGCAYNVANGLGNGFLEKVYENALFVELTRAGLRAVRQKAITIYWRGAVVGEYCADIVVEESVLIELKACKALDEIHTAQCLNYLKATGIKICLLINFGKSKIDVKRIVHNL